MRDTYHFDHLPTAETGASVGDHDYLRHARRECYILIRQLRRQFGSEPPGSYWRMTSHPHDFGDYLQVTYVYDNEDDAHNDYLRRVDDEFPACWDEIASRECSLSPIGGEK